MRFSADRRTVGRNWGRAPSRIGAVDATIGSPLFAKGEFKARALETTGRPAGLATMRSSGVLSPGVEADLLLLSPRPQTMWGLLTRTTR